MELRGRPLLSCKLAGGGEGLRTCHLSENHPQNETPEALQVSVMLHNLIISSSLFFVFSKCYKSSFVLGLPLPRNKHLCLFLLVALPKLVSGSSVRPGRDSLGGGFHRDSHRPLTTSQPCQGFFSVPCHPK